MLLVSLYAILFQVSIFIEVPDVVIFSLVLLSPFLVLYMAYVVLKYGKPSGNRFDDQFYEDHAYRRNGKESLGE